MNNYWEIELSGLGPWDGKTITIPRNGDNYPLIYSLPLEQPSTEAILEFHLYHRKEDGVLVYRQKGVEY